MRGRANEPGTAAEVKKYLRAQQNIAAFTRSKMAAHLGLGVHALRYRLLQEGTDFRRLRRAEVMRRMREMRGASAAEMQRQMGYAPSGGGHVMDWRHVV